jgi:hypothetical protein
LHPSGFALAGQELLPEMFGITSDVRFVEKNTAGRAIEDTVSRQRGASAPVGVDPREGKYRDL